jgi:GTP-binding protein
MAEKLSVVMARRHIDMAHVVLIILDAEEGLVGLDATIAGYAHEAGRGLILVVNKWDMAADPNRGTFSKTVRESFKFLAHAPIAYVSAKTGAGVSRLFQLVTEVFESCSLRVPTGELNRFAESLELEPDTRVKYLTQVSVRPPTFVLFTDHRGPLHFSAERNLINRLRQRFGFRGAPIVVKTKESRKPTRQRR